MSGTPSHCVLIARHINYPQHDELPWRRGLEMGMEAEEP